MKLLHARIILVILFSMATPVFGWNKEGHQIVAAIAYDQLSPAQQEELVAILRQHPRFNEDFQRAMPRNLDEAQQRQWIFLRAAIWPDLVRSSPRNRNSEKTAYHRGSWHYINEPFYLTPEDEQALASRINANLARSLNASTPEAKWNILQALEHNVIILRNDQANSRDRAVSLCWILHLVGDLHQPLHSTALFARPRFREGDKGGNAIPINPPRTGPYRFAYDKMSLHSIWDDILGQRLSDHAILDKAAALLEQDELRHVGRQASQNLDAVAWMQESHHLAMRVAYDSNILDDLRNDVDEEDQDLNDNLEPFTLPLEYYIQASDVAKKRAVEAGFRLGRLLEGDSRDEDDNDSFHQPAHADSVSSASPTDSNGPLGSVSICSFNIQFLGQSTIRDNASLAELVSGYDIVVVQELLAPPYAGAFLDGAPFRPDPEATAFFDEMKSHGFRFVLSEEDTGKSASNKNNGSATEWFVVFYRPNGITTANDLPSGFLASDRTANVDYDRVPYAFSFRTRDNNLDFVLISVHLRPSPGTVNAARRKHELASIGRWVQSRNSPEKDYIILGDMNIESAAELISATPPGFKSVNYYKADAQHPADYCLPTNTNRNSRKPYDHVMLNLTHTREYDSSSGFKVIDLVQAMRSKWPQPSDDPYPGDPYDHDAFRFVYSDHNPVVVQLIVPDRDDD